jgi:hypothetical protein
LIDEKQDLCFISILNELPEGQERSGGVWFEEMGGNDGA